MDQKQPQSENVEPAGADQATEDDPRDQAQAMEQAQEEAAEERKDERGYQ